VGSAHDHGGGDHISRGTRRGLVVVVSLVVVVTGIAMALLWPGPIDTRAGRQLGLVSDVHAAEVQRVTSRPCAGTQQSDRVRCIRVRFRLLAGPDEGELRSIEFPRSATTPDLEPGDEIVLSHRSGTDRRFEYDYADRQRRIPLLGLAALFVLAVVLLARVRGVFALVGLAASIAVLMMFTIPALLEGTSPVLIAVVSSSAIACLALFLAHGFRPMTLVALLGTLVALGVTIALASVFTELTELTGFVSEEAFLVTVGRSGFDVRGLVLAGMVIGALGALDDMTITQAAAVVELRAANETMSRRALARAGLRIGRDHVASTVNTLALAYAGAALPLLILFVLAQQSLGTVVNSEIVATEVVRTLVGSIGLVAAVPVTTWLAAAVVGPGATADASPVPDAFPVPDASAAQRWASEHLGSPSEVETAFWKRRR
jgi:uncharacterized membrane protein